MTREGLPARRICAVVCRVGMPALVDMVDTDYEALSKLVGGYVEFAFVSDSVELCCNEEGAINGMPHNRNVPAMAPPLPAWLQDAFVIDTTRGEAVLPGSGQVGVHEVHGDFMLTGPNLTSLSEDLADQLATLLNVRV